MTFDNDMDTRSAIARLHRLRTEALFAVHYANRAFVERGWGDPVYVTARDAMDAVMLPLARAKWQLGQVDGSAWGLSAPAPDPRAVAEASASALQKVIHDCRAIRAACERGEEPQVRRDADALKTRNETQFFDGVPIVPSIAPIVVLQGASHDMGRQYVQQVLDIYGNWIFQQQVNAVTTDNERAEVQRWTEELALHAPDVRAFAAGMVDGARSRGLPMNEVQALAIWTGTRPPAREARPMAFAQTKDDGEQITAAYLGVSTASSDGDMCSGIFSWGRGTTDGSLVAGSTTDHDCTFQATIVAFPTDGHAYIYTPFSANGFIPVLGEFHMAGHPGMNNQGVAYVHHGGANTGEPLDQWGYGIRRGASTMQLLQTCSTAVEARDAQRRFPVGDVGISLGTAGGMYGDANYGFSIEARPGAPAVWQPIIREHTLDAYGVTYDFLYANNNALAPESAHLNVPPPGGYQYTIAGGWFTRDWAQINAEPGPKAFRRLNTRNSEGRNRYAYRMMMSGYGQIDPDYMTMVYRQGGEMPPGDLAELQRVWHAGVPWNSSTAHRANAFTAVMNPQRGDGGTYLGCVGPANRAVQPRGPEHGYYYFDETNTFWQLRLRRGPAAVLDAAIADGVDAVNLGAKALATLSDAHPGARKLDRWIEEARRHLHGARELIRNAGDADGDAALARLSKALRLAVRAQVRARQVIEAVDPPPVTLAQWQDTRVGRHPT